MVEFGERLRLFDEAVEAPLVVAGTGLGARSRGDVAVPRGTVGGEILLDRDLARERQLVGEIGDAKATRAEDALDAIVADEFSAGRQREQVGHR